jgi:hypothetical protein
MASKSTGGKAPRKSVATRAHIRPASAPVIPVVRYQPVADHVAAASAAAKAAPPLGVAAEPQHKKARMEVFAVAPFVEEKEDESNALLEKVSPGSIIRFLLKPEKAATHLIPLLLRLSKNDDIAAALNVRMKPKKIRSFAADFAA